MAEVFSTFELAQGTAAPAFALPDADGKITSFQEAAGNMGTLVIFACNHCPYIIHLANKLSEFSKELSAQNIATIAINSNDIVRYPADSPEKMKLFSKEYAWDFPYLLDESQDIARAFGAACTPDFFLFDSQNRLFYTGQFDDSRPHKGKASGCDLRLAVAEMLQGKVPMKGRPASGCSIKWK